MLHQHARPAVAGGFLGGALLGAMTTGLALAVLAGLLSPAPVAWRAGLALCLLGLLALHQAGILCLDLPQRAWQIPREVFFEHPVRAAATFAFELGTGVRTYITTAAPYGLAVVLVLAPGSTTTAALLGAVGAALGYGLGRAWIVLGQVARKRVAVDHPAGWLRAASWVSLAASAIVAVQVLTG